MLNKNECTIIIYSYFAVCNGRHNALRYSNSLLKYKVYEVNSTFITRKSTFVEGFKLLMPLRATSILVLVFPLLKEGLAGSWGGP